MFQFWRIYQKTRFFRVDKKKKFLKSGNWNSGKWPLGKLEFGKLNFGKLDFRKMDIRKIEIRKIEFRKIEFRKIGFRKIDFGKLTCNPLIRIWHFRSRIENFFKVKFFDFGNSTWYFWACTNLRTKIMKTVSQKFLSHLQIFLWTISTKFRTTA